MAIAGSLAMEGPVITWVADHRRHHKYSDKEGDPHSPWRYGDDAKALAKGLIWAHIIWLFDPNQTSQEKFAPDLLADKKIRTGEQPVPRDRRVQPDRPRADRRLLDLGGLSWHGAIRRSSGPAWSASPCCTT